MLCVSPVYLCAARGSGVLELGDVLKQNGGARPRPAVNLLT